MGRMTIADIRALEIVGYNTFVATTASDYWQAVGATEGGATIILVDDQSVSKYFFGRTARYGFSTTLDEMILATKAIRNGAENSLLIPIIPFGYANTPEYAVESVTRIMKETGADAVYMKNASVECVSAVVNAGWPVLGHAGNKQVPEHNGYPQEFIGESTESARKILDQCVALAESGVFGIVLERIPAELAKEITDTVDVCTIGLGAGRYCNGQLLHMEDYMGYLPESVPKCVKKYTNMRGYFSSGVRAFVDDVLDGHFPDDIHSFQVNKKCMVYDISNRQ